MIKFAGIKYNKTVCYLIMNNELGQSVNIPIDKSTADIISAYLAKISTAAPIPVEREEDDLV